MNTCSETSIGQVWGNGDLSTLIDAHALHSPVHSCDEPAQSYLANERASTLKTVCGGERKEEEHRLAK